MSSGGGRVGVGVDFESLLDFARGFPELAGELLGEFARELHREFHNRALELARELSPRGFSSRAGHVPLRETWASSPGAEGAIAAGRPTKVFTKAPHAGVIDAGAPQYAEGHKRRTSSGRTVTVRPGRQVGSFQSPLGVRAAVVARLAAEESAIVERAVARVVGSGGGDYAP